MQRRFKRMLVACAATSALLAGNVHAGSFALKERSAKAQGLSFAGATAGSGGLQSMGFNPAAIGMVEEFELSGGLSFIQPIADGVVTATGERVDADRFAGLANGYMGYRFDPEFLFGISLYTPFGLVTGYEPTSAVAADAETSKLQTFVFAPTIAYQPDPSVTFALAANIIYANARLTSAALNLDGDAVSMGFTVGIMWEPIDGTTVGLAYDHGYDLTLPGTAVFRPASGSPLAGQPLAQEASADLPATISAGLIQDISPDFRLMGEFQYQLWSSFDSIDVSIATPAGLVDIADVQNYENAFFIAVGGEYDVTNALTLRAGAAWDETPTINGITGRTPRVPDEDRIWLSLGATYDVTEHMSIDLGYSYLFALEDPVVTLRNGPAAGTTVVYDGGAHIFSVGGSLTF